MSANPDSQPIPPLAIPAELLEGLDLGHGWRVVRKLPRSPGGTGANFSVGYEVGKNTGERGFLKALDFVSRLAFSDDQARDLQAMTEAFNFERSILGVCRRMSRIVTAIEEGAVTVPGIQLGSVQYLIFELVDGDVRWQLDAARQFDIAWALRTLHHVAVGLSQLHRAGMAHQDTKPSNVLMFDRGKSAKLADLGRAAWRGHAAPHDGLHVAGDPAYAPPEMLYGQAPAEWNTRRIGCDVYHLGSMVVFFVTRNAMTPLMIHYLDPTHRPPDAGGTWTGSYADVLPHVRAAFEQAIVAFDADAERLLGREVGGELTKMVRQLCDPDPMLRGHPKNRGKSLGPLALERFVARLNLLAHRAEAELRRRA